MARIPVALQLYSVRNEFAKDPRRTLKAVAAMGYEGVEFFAAPQHPARDLRAMLEEAGLPCCGWHTPFNLVQDDRLAETIAFNQTLGNRRIIVPSIPENLRASRADWLTMAGFFNQLAAKLAPHGMAAGYHNHNVEFTPVEGELPWDTFFSHANKEVIMQFDTGNALSAGAETVPFLKRYPGRAGTVHLKPYSVAAGKKDRRKGFQPLIGEDDVPWAEVFRLCETIGGTQWYIVEYEDGGDSPLEAVKRCLQKLKAMGK